VVHLLKVASKWNVLEKRGLGSILTSFDKSGELAARVGSRPCWLPNIVKMFLESVGIGGEVVGLSEDNRDTGILMPNELGGELVPIGLVALPDLPSDFPNVEIRFQNQTVRSRSIANVDAELVESFLAIADARKTET